MEENKVQSCNGYHHFWRNRAIES